MDQQEMRHLFARHRQNLAAPIRDQFRDQFRVWGRRLIGPLQAEGGIELNAHQAMLDLGGLGEAGEHGFTGG
jgi:hypothetical protein